MSDLKRVKAAIKKNTKIVWIESPTNPTLKCTDIAEMAKICKAKGILLAIDNTFMSPVLQVSDPVVLSHTLRPSGILQTSRERDISRSANPQY